MYLGTRSARAAAPDLEAAEAELAAAARADGVVATEPRRALGRRRALDAGRRRRARLDRRLSRRLLSGRGRRLRWQYDCKLCQ